MTALPTQKRPAVRLTFESGRGGEIVTPLRGPPFRASLAYGVKLPTYCSQSNRATRLRYAPFSYASESAGISGIPRGKAILFPKIAFRCSAKASGSILAVKKRGNSCCILTTLTNSDLKVLL